jgi:L-lactate dehydrogenase complex protein LldF
MIGIDEGGELPFVSTLCGACQQECPVNIDLPHQLVHMRRKAVEAGIMSSGAERTAIRVWANAMNSAGAYRMAVAAARLASAAASISPWLPGPARAWSKQRTVPRIAKETFKEWWLRR